MIRFVGCPEPNFRRGRPFGLRPEAIVVHLIDGSFAAGESVFRDPNAHKSAHYAVSRVGEIHQYVDENDTAFHAGIVVNPTWSLLKPRINPNFYTIGIEHEGRPDDVWPDAQLEASASLLGQIAARWNIQLDDDHVIRHHQIRASKTCPGNWLKIGEILKRVPMSMALIAVATAPAIVVEAEPSPPTTVTVVPVAPSSKMMVVRTIRNVNLRRARPLTSAPIVRVIPAHTDVAAANFEAGESVSGNPHWYVDVQGNYFWAGATNVPDPTAMAA
jgi:N-acetylmuramoyl-L-alanine amidase